MIHTLKNSALIISINSFGAELCSVKNNHTHIEYIWQANPAIWARHAPNLFPIVGKLNNETYTFENKNYNLPQHGFARDSQFICIEETEDKLVFELTASDKTLVIFPFHFSLQLTFQLIDNKLVTRYAVFNPDNKSLYFSIGAHPAFNCKLIAGNVFEDMELIFPTLNDITINILNNGLISNKTKTIALHNKTLAVTKQLFNNDALVLINNQVNEIHLLSNKTKQGVKIKCANWPYFGIWAKPQTDDFICLEPWYGIADFENAGPELTEKTGIVAVLPEQYFNCEFEIEFV